MGISEINVIGGVAVGNDSFEAESFFGKGEWAVMLLGAGDSTGKNGTAKKRNRTLIAFQPWKGSMDAAAYAADTHWCSSLRTSQELASSKVDNDTFKDYIKNQTVLHVEVKEGDSFKWKDGNGVEQTIVPLVWKDITVVR